ncbi:epoxide hydrolase family protein [Actinomadura oligospora]|uniref:epoxide hydrolase family protein n=1 Tax=Actinomadura oligospora TaxID=111804 RepID=UPI0004AF8366|nr:epoxide hydrolase family protein [Actinomadura oligospora]
MGWRVIPIEPFIINIPQADLDDLRERLGRTRLPSEVPGAGWERGVPVSHLSELIEYWTTTYDWRVHEAELNAHPQFITEIDGQRIHFLHVRSDDPDALPLILTHGWPSSVVEFLDVIEPLSRDFHLVIPSLPGFGFSGPQPDGGWTLDRIARAWAELMARLGYDRYGAHGGDWGSGVARELGRVDPDHLVGIHINYLLTFPTGPVDDLDESDRARLEGLERFTGDLGGSMAVQSTRPQTLAYGLADSPAGQLAWIAEKFKEWTDGEIDRDRLLTNVTIYWLTNTASSSAQLYWEFAHAWSRPERSPVPTGVAVFPHDVALPVRKLAEQTDTIVHWTEFDHGGHFAALEQPKLLAEDIRAFYRSL